MRLTHNNKTLNFNLNLPLLYYIIIKYHIHNIFVFFIALFQVLCEIKSESTSISWKKTHVVFFLYLLQKQFVFSYMCISRAFNKWFLSSHRNCWINKVSFQRLDFLRNEIYSMRKLANNAEWTFLALKESDFSLN
jgi:hypothetical protein